MVNIYYRSLDMSLQNLMAESPSRKEIHRRHYQTTVAFIVQPLFESRKNTFI